MLRKPFTYASAVPVTPSPATPPTTIPMMKKSAERWSKSHPRVRRPQMRRAMTPMRPRVSP
jgi:hypothetical protein